jgi:hypothetical protein
MKPKFTGSKCTASPAGSKRSSVGSIGRDGAKRAYPFFALCIEHGQCKASLEVGKAYQVVRPESNDPAYFLRVIDEEGEDYLYPADWFVPIDLPPKAKRALVAASA